MSALNQFRTWLEGAREHGVRAHSVFLIGLGRFGTALAETLAELQVEVMAIDVEQRLVDQWADRLANVRRADGTDPRVLEQLGAADFDAAVVAIGTGIEASILATTALAEAGCANIWAKAITDQHGRILERVGAHHVVHPERQMGERVAHIVAGQVVDYFQLDPGFVLAEVEAPSFLQGRTLAEAGIRKDFGVTVVCIKPGGGAFTYATAETVAQPGDLILVAGTVQDIERFAQRVAAT